MPTKPSNAEIMADAVMKSNPDFARQTVEAIINETPELKKALLDAGLVKEA